MPTDKKPQYKAVETITHDEASRKNIPTAELQSVLQKNEQNPVRIAYERRNRDLDPQLVWRGKDDQDWSERVVVESAIWSPSASSNLIAHLIRGLVQKCMYFSGHHVIASSTKRVDQV
jgi:hypothetical protein